MAATNTEEAPKVELGAVKKSDQETWRRGSVAKRVSSLLESEFMADCSFLLQDSKQMVVRIPAHRLLLSQASPVFQAMLSETWRPETRDSEDIEIEDFSADTFRRILRFLYTDQVDIPDMDSALELLSAANMYLLPDLLDHCVGYIKGRVTAETVFKVLELANALDFERLRDIVAKFLVENTSAVLSAPSFLECSAANLRLILELDTLNLCSELDLVKACKRWGEQRVLECEAECSGESAKPGITLRAALGDLVPLLRLRSVDPTHLASHVMPSGLLTDKEQCAVVSSLLLKGPMPQGFCDKTRNYELAECALATTTDEVELIKHCENGRLDEAKQLLQNGVSPNVADDSGITPLHYAVRRGFNKVLEVLLAAGANPNVKDKSHSSPLQCALLFVNMKAVSLLVEHGSHVNFKDKAGQSLLHTLAVSTDYYDNYTVNVARVLLDSDAEINARDNAGKTALTIAREKRKKELVTFLESRGATV